MNTLKLTLSSLVPTEEGYVEHKKRINYVDYESEVADAHMVACKVLLEDFRVYNILDDDYSLANTIINYMTVEDCHKLENSIQQTLHGDPLSVGYRTLLNNILSIESLDMIGIVMFDDNEFNDDQLSNALFYHVGNFDDFYNKVYMELKDIKTGEDLSKKYEELRDMGRDPFIYVYIDEWISYVTEMSMYDNRYCSSLLAKEILQHYKVDFKTDMTMYNRITRFLTRLTKLK